MRPIVRPGHWARTGNSSRGSVLDHAYRYVWWHESGKLSLVNQSIPKDLTRPARRKLPGQ